MSIIELFQSSSIETFVSSQYDFWCFSGSDNEHVGKSGREGFALGVSNSDYIKITLMSFSMGNNSNTTNIISSSNISNIL